MHQPSREPDRSIAPLLPPAPVGQPSRRLPAHLAEELSTAQTLVYARQADVAQTRATLAHEEATLSEAMAQLNKVIHSLL
ncbi:hypothetical protein ACFUCH_03665 [Streptomyces olivaceus]|uniref:hypothetical protein n=1 Tax=Streptomyces olivaceus TaxID=47716 RepID=UPI00363967CD